MLAILMDSKIELNFPAVICTQSELDRMLLAVLQEEVLYGKYIVCFV